MEDFNLKLAGNYSETDLNRMENWGGFSSEDLKIKTEIRQDIISLVPKDEDYTLDWKKIGGLFEKIGMLEFKPFENTFGPQGGPVDGGNDHTPTGPRITPETFKKAAELVKQKPDGRRNINEKEGKIMDEAINATWYLIATMKVDNQFTEEDRTKLNGVMIKAHREK